MFAFIRKHWVAYLIGAAFAAALGLGVSYILGVKWSTPEDVRAERQEAYAEDAEERNEIAGDESQNVDESMDEDQATEAQPTDDQSTDTQSADAGSSKE